MCRSICQVQLISSFGRICAWLLVFVILSLNQKKSFLRLSEISSSQFNALKRTNVMHFRLVVAYLKGRLYVTLKEVN